MRRTSSPPVDRFICNFDAALRATVGGMGQTGRPSPGAGIADSPMPDTARQTSGRLMRVNHTGEVCAQALYNGQALSARSPRVAKSFREAAAEEEDHLYWCESRIRELDSHLSYLNPIWYLGSFTMGAVTGLLGDRISLGFVAATEEEVCKHLDDHLEKLSPEDRKSREILEQMRTDEQKHATNALASGGTRFPEPVKKLMPMVSGLMTRTSYWI
ncbi:MAG: 2-polyprenyl-3-methyl-6-methoxy-1,4-benzoquinone monooxygenase [Pseudomonadales bacterium]|nr:2-polyprenyl-3-methyl-6-methoxy-1,4-benzoquinone monooxygenase [Pseudomonadales bacterium]